MDAETLEALKGSIRKWEAIVDGTGIDEGWINCPLCRLFLKTGCAGCPVMEKTGIETCLATPYVDYRRAANKRSNDAHAAAIQEMDFLRSLLPESKDQ